MLCADPLKRVDLIKTSSKNRMKNQKCTIQLTLKCNVECLLKAIKYSGIVMKCLCSFNHPLESSALSQTYADVKRIKKISSLSLRPTLSSLR